MDRRPTLSPSRELTCKLPIIIITIIAIVIITIVSIIIIRIINKSGLIAFFVRAAVFLNLHSCAVVRTSGNAVITHSDGGRF